MALGSPEPIECCPSSVLESQQAALELLLSQVPTTAREAIAQLEAVMVHCGLSGEGEPFDAAIHAAVRNTIAYLQHL